MWTRTREGGSIKIENVSGGLSFSILVVDDEPAVREVFSRFLERRGHQVVTCGSAAEGFRQAEGTAFDVIVCDLLLPDESGLVLVERLRKAHYNAKVILLTGKPSKEAAQRADELDVYAFIAKPIRASALIEVVEQAALG